MKTGKSKIKKSEKIDGQNVRQLVVVMAAAAASGFGRCMYSLWSTAPYHTCLSSRGEGCTWLTAMCDTAEPGTTLTMRGASTEGPHRGAMGAMGAIGPMGPAITAGPIRLGDGPGAGAGAGAAAARLRRATKTHCSRRR